MMLPSGTDAVFCHDSKGNPAILASSRFATTIHVGTAHSKQKNRFARTQSYKLYLDGKMFNVSADVLEQHSIEPETMDAKQIRDRLQAVLDAAPPWNPKPERNNASLKARKRN